MVKWSMALLSYFICYKHLHFLMGFPRINKLLTYTSLTTWKLWQRDKIPNRPVSDTLRVFGHRVVNSAREIF